MLGKAIILEQLTYYAFSKNNKASSVEWSINKSNGEIDILVKIVDAIKIIECKVNPNNSDLPKEYEKLLVNLERYSEKDKNGEFWFWIKPSPQNTKWLEDNGIRYEYVNPTERLPIILNGINPNNMKFVMNYQY